MLRLLTGATLLTTALAFGAKQSCDTCAQTFVKRGGCPLLRRSPQAATALVTKDCYHCINEATAECSHPCVDHPCGTRGTCSEVAMPPPPASNAYEYFGCYKNEGVQRVDGHIQNMTLGSCEKRAQAKHSPFLGLEFPQGFSTVGAAQCLVFGSVPTMDVAESDADCEGEGKNPRLGGPNRLAIYRLKGANTPVPTTVHTTHTATPTSGTVLSGPGGYKIIRFMVTPRTGTRGGNKSNSVQLSEIQFYNGDVKITGGKATNPGGQNPDAEKPVYAVDGSLTTKWLDFRKGSLVVTFPKKEHVTSYRWATANDATERDPIRWTLQGSNDGSTWATLSAKYATTAYRPSPARGQWQGPFLTNQRAAAPTGGKGGSGGSGASDDGSADSADGSDDGSVDIGNIGRRRTQMLKYSCRCHTGWAGTKCQTRSNRAPTARPTQLATMKATVCHGSGGYAHSQQACYWSSYNENVDWRYYTKKGSSLRGCTLGCSRDKNCTGFEYSRDGSYCAFWLHGKCAGKCNGVAPGKSSACWIKTLTEVTYTKCSAMGKPTTGGKGMHVFPARPTRRPTGRGMPRVFPARPTRDPTMPSGKGGQGGSADASLD